MKRLLEIGIETHQKEEILEQIIKYINNPTHFIHIVSLNPENMVIAQDNQEFKIALKQAQIKINDGVGILLACSILNNLKPPRITGVNLMEAIISLCHKCPIRVVLIGGKTNLANELAECYQKKYPQAQFIGIEGFRKIDQPTKIEEKTVFSIISSVRPQVIFAAFGSPAQELWFWRNKERLKGIICMGVGQGFNVIAGQVRRAPAWMRSTGLEWLYRLLTQPWRWRRQLRLITFAWLVIKQKFSHDS